MRLSLKVIPGASTEGIAGWLGETLKVRVRAPAERGKANAAVEKIVSTALDVPQRTVRIAKGKTSARKIIEVDDLSIDEIRSRLGDSSNR